MKPRNLLNLALLVLVGALLAVVLLEPGKEPEPAPERLTSLSPDAVGRIRIERAGGTTVVAERRDGDWRLVQPVVAEGNRYRFESLLQLVEARSFSRFPVGGEPARFGLDEPGVTVSFDRTTLRFGGTAPLDQRRYVQVGDTVHVIADSYYYHLIGAPGTFVDTRLLPAGTEPTRIELPQFTLRQEPSGWQVDPRPADYSADAGVILVDNWKQGRAVEVKLREEPLIDSESPKVRIDLSEGEPITFVIATHEPQTVLVREGTRLAYHLANGTARDLLTLPEPDVNTEN